MHKRTKYIVVYTKVSIGDGLAGYNDNEYDKNQIEEFETEADALSWISTINRDWNEDICGPFRLVEYEPSHTKAAEPRCDMEQNCLVDKICEICELDNIQLVKNKFDLELWECSMPDRFDSRNGQPLYMSREDQQPKWSYIDGITNSSEVTLTDTHLIIKNKNTTIKYKRTWTQ